MMNEASERAYPMDTMGAGQAMKQAYVDREQKITVGENIDLKIQQAEERLQKLREVKAELEASGLLTLKISSLAEAMRFANY